MWSMINSEPNDRISDSIVPVCICMLIEKGLALDIIREGAGMFAHVLNIMVLVLIPMVIIHVNGNAFSLSELNEPFTLTSTHHRVWIINLCLFVVGAMAVCFHYSVLFMKLWSYIQVNMWCRNAFNDPPAKARNRSQSITVAELRTP